MDAVRRSLEVDYAIDMILNNGFEITKPTRYSEVNINIDALVNSPRYMETEYTCDCGAFIGRDILGQKCPCCHSEIRLRSINFEYTGWINLGNHKVITPTHYKKITRVIGKNMLKFILDDYKDDRSVKYNENDTAYDERHSQKRRGKQAANDINTIKKKIAKIRHCYQGIGHDEFYKNFEEIMRNCALSQHQEELETLINEKEKVFTSKIPVYSTAFRPVVKTSEDLKYPKVNKLFSSICSIQTRLPDMILKEEISQALNDIQAKWIEAADQTLRNEMSKKRGSIRSEIVGGTFSFSARAVVTLKYLLRADHVLIPFPMAITEFQFKITHRLALRYHMTLESAYLYVSNHPRAKEVIQILDEDMNIGGETANKVGRELAALGRRRQILCISHLAQVAARADHHFKVEKSDQNGRTVSRIVPLDDPVPELARMLGGGASALDHAGALHRELHSR